jgi:hypothetical protein
MKITVKSIRPCDNHDLPKMEATVELYDENVEYYNSAIVNVFIEKRDALLSELKKDAIQKAIDFLKLAVSSHSL